MTASGTFPKVDGDILYAYDVNRFNRTLFIGSTAVFNSGTTTAVGSVLIPANSLSNPFSMNITYRGSGTFIPQIQLSGANAIDVTLIDSSTTSQIHPVGRISVISGSPMQGCGVIENGPLGAAFDVSDTREVNNYNTLLDTYCNFYITTAQSSGGYNAICITTSNIN